MSGAPVDPAHDASRRAGRGGAAERARGQRADRALRARPRLPAVRRGAARGAPARSQASSRAASPTRRARSRRCTRHSASSFASSGPQEPFLHPGKAARTDAGWLGELHPARLEGSWGVFELDLATLFAGVEPVPLYEDVITYPPVRQDLAVVVAEEVPAGSLVEAVREAAGTELREARVFDVYRGEQVGPGRKSVALALVFQSAERTLSDDDAAAAAAADRAGARRPLRRRVARLTIRIGASLRSVSTMRVAAADPRCRRPAPGGRRLRPEPDAVRRRRPGILDPVLRRLREPGQEPGSRHLHDPDRGQGRHPQLPPHRAGRGQGDGHRADRHLHLDGHASWPGSTTTSATRTPRR